VRGSSAWMVTAMLGFALGAAACGGTGTTASTSPTPTIASPSAIPTTTAASPTCPTGARVGAALGITLPTPVGVAGGGGTQLPPGAVGVACEYHAATYNVIIEIIRNISPSYIIDFSSKFPVAFMNVAGVGDQARAFTAPLGPGKVNEGVVATKGATLVAIVATATPASLAQLEALVNQLL
jgi:hypothetical protein